MSSPLEVASDEKALTSLAAVLFALPVQAGGVHLILISGVEGKYLGYAAVSDSTSMVSVSMETLEGCDEAGQEWISAKPKIGRGFRRYACLEVK